MTKTATSPPQSWFHSASPLPSIPRTGQSSQEGTAQRQPAKELLRLGDRGAYVRHLQRALRDNRYWVGPVDGVFDTLTRQAVYALQKAAGIRGHADRRV
ncbi:peptidoglycan-binding domain-containing protein [Nonomuraea sp. SYSU D8015]|uniref:peptidoglycan-binding domain-containing protein n=1 Tax=Nonomuraea sp. SYSU D8015 TaxID=2593644 RepID=UPI001CB6EAB7|nr:peptidoglycan-binding domain-containing protein [Nonomuraea sp. SYSU D8015]